MTQTRQIYTLEDLYEQRFAPVSTLDLNRVLATIEAYGQFLANDMADQLDMFTEETVQSRAVWGGASLLDFEEVGEFGKGKPRKDNPGQEVHFPLYKLSASQGGSEEFWNRASVNNLREALIAMDNGYARRVRDEIQAAIFNNTVRTPTKDWLVDNSTLNKVQPFLNADGGAIPPAPNGTTFVGATHNHYLGTTGSSLAVADVDYLLGHVAEHMLGKVNLFIDPAMPATLAGLASTKFVARPPAPIVNQTAAQVSRESFNPDADRGNMSVGYWDGYEVVTRSWVPTGYMAAMAVGGQLGKPLHRRVDPAFPGLITGIQVTDGRIAIKESHFYMGIGAFNRAAGAVLKATAQATYAVPSGLIRS